MLKLLLLPIVAFTTVGHAFHASTLAARVHKSDTAEARAKRFRIAQNLSDSESKGSSCASDLSEDKISILVCPAQFCVPADYEALFDNLKMLESQGVLSKKIGTFQVAPLPRTEWIKVARQLPTKAFLDAQLPVQKTLGWYFEAIDQALSQIFAQEGASARICIIGHSIGGWVARAYLGGLAESSTAVHRHAVDQISSLITIGTPHTSPDSALVDQTRGLLRAIAESPTCQPQALADRGIDITCVCSDSLGGKVLSANVEELISAASYFPLLGKLGANGDGIVPLELAFMDAPARRVVVSTCDLTKQPVRHAHIVPTPWNLIDGYAPSIKLPEDKFPSYISPGVLPQWAKYIV